MTSPARPVERIEFDTELLPPDSRLARYRALYSAGADIQQTGPNLRATFRGWRLDRAFLYDRRLNDVGHSRDPENLSRYGLSHWTATLVLSGRLTVDLGMGIMGLTAGDLVFTDTNAPLRNEACNVHVATLSMASRRLEDMVGPLDGLHGLIANGAHTELYDPFIRSLLKSLPTLGERSLPGLTTALGGLLASTIEVCRSRENALAQSRQNTRLLELQAVVDARLSDPDFGPEEAIAEVGLSRATLYRALRAQGGLAKFILARRLEYVRRLLSHPGEDRRFGVIARAAGFEDENQANRAFLARFGTRPGIYRAAVQRAEPDEQFRTWQRELR